MPEQRPFIAHPLLQPVQQGRDRQKGIEGEEDAEHQDQGRIPETGQEANEKTSTSRQSEKRRQKAAKGLYENEEKR